MGSAWREASEHRCDHQEEPLDGINDLGYGVPRAPTAVPTDPVQHIVFSFYADQLFKLVVDDDRDRTEGMTDADMVEAISTRYGSPVTPLPRPSRGTCPRNC